jgi:hypothetical protein
MTDLEAAERVAAEVAEDVEREFPGVSVTLDFDAAREEQERAILWISPGTEDREEINDIWAYAVKLVQDAYNSEDVYLVARMKGVGVIDRERPSDIDF